MTLRFLLCAALLLAACDGCGGEGDNNAGYDDPPDWAPTTKAPPDGCEGCPEVELGELGGHGADVIFLQDPDVDDELVQWATCLTSFMACVDAGESTDPCMRAAPCPSKCKDAYFAATRSLPDDDYDSRADAIEEVFMNAGGVCVPDEVTLARPAGDAP